MPCGRQGVGATSRHRNRKASIQQLHCKRRKSANKLHKNTHHRDLLSIHCVRRNTCQGDLLIESHFLTCFSQCRSLLNSLSSLLQHRLGFTFWLFGHKTWETLAPRPEIEPAPPALEGKVLTPGPPGTSLDVAFWRSPFKGLHCRREEVQGGTNPWRGEGGAGGRVVQPRRPAGGDLGHAQKARGPQYRVWGGAHLPRSEG